MAAWIVAVGAVSSVPAETLMVCKETVSVAGDGGGGGEGLAPSPPPPQALSKKNIPQTVPLSKRADIPISVIVFLRCSMPEE